MKKVQRKARRGGVAAGARARPQEILRAHLEKHGLRRSRVRDAVADTFFATPGHVSVEELTGRVRRRDPGIGHTTVYRTLRLLAECGLAEPHDFGDGMTRYDPVREAGHHDHLVCTACGTIVEFENPEIEELQGEVARRHRFVTENHKLELYGRCARCRGGRPGGST
ncbi:MAG TPA: transcriptional repressor [Anaeromyxobacteraceae bacterium]|nr:transcriptional repressor [Anaeromyxobacteraceae bacterium]